MYLKIKYRFRGELGVDFQDSIWPLFLHWIEKLPKNQKKC